MRQRFRSLGLAAGSICGLVAALILARQATPPSAQTTPLLALTSHIAVMNPGTIPAIASVNYVGAEGSCAGKSIPHGAGQQTIPAGSVVLFDQDPGTASGLDKSCNASAVVSVARGSALAVVIDGADDGRGNQRMLSAYRAVSGGEVAADTELPLWQTKTGDDLRTMLVQAMNVSDTRDRGVTLRITDPKGNAVDCPAADCVADLDSHEAAAWWPPSLKSLVDVDATFGTAEVSAKQALAVVASTYALAGSNDSTAANGLPLGGQSVGTGQIVFPLALRGVDAAGGGMAPGTGESALRLHNGSANVPVQPFGGAFPFAGGGQVPLIMPKLDPSLAAWAPLLQQTALKPGSYALRLSGEIRPGAILRTEWGGAATDVNESQSALNLVVPFVAKQFRDLSSAIVIHNLDDQSAVAVVLRLTPGGSATGQVQTVDVPAGGTKLVQIADAFPNFPDGAYGSLQLFGRGEIAALGVLVSAANRTVAAAYEAVPASAAATELFAPMVHSEWALPRFPQQATPTASAGPTDTPTPSPTPTRRGQASDTPTATSSPTPTRPRPTDTDTPTVAVSRTPLPRTPRATPNIRNGWRWPILPERLAEADEKPRCVTRAKDATLWVRVATSGRGPDRILVVNEARGSLDIYPNLAEAIVARLAQVRQLKKLACFFTVDRQNRVWIGTRFFDGQKWVDAGRDEPQDGGEIRFLERILLDRDDHAWVPWQADRECLLGTDCRTFGLRLVNEDGTVGGGLMAEPPPEAGRYDIEPFQLVEDESPTTLQVSSAIRQSPADRATRSDPFAAERVWQSGVAGTDFAVLSRSVVKMPDKTTYPLPNLADPVLGSKGIGNAGYSTASLRDPATGELLVITWVELHQGSGANRRVTYKILLNRWNGVKWTVEDLSGGQVFLDDPAVPNDGLVLDRVTAAGMTSGGTLWIGTASGRVASRKNLQWDRLYKPNDADSPLSGEPIKAVTVDETGAKPDVCFLSPSLVLCQSEGESDLGPPTIYAPRTVKNSR